MAATMATSMALLNPKCFTPKTPTTTTTSKPSKPLLSLPKFLTPAAAAPLTAPAVAGAVFAALSAAEPAFAAQQLADIAEGDNRGLALLIPLIPAILWVLYNILQPALNQINKMRSSKAIIAGLGGGLAAAGLLHPQEAAAAAEAAADNRGQLLLFVVAPAIGWVLYNILQPALNQINRMRSD
ncbi:photosystem II core complex proteins psbY, chloroplastic-like [Salvia splendens]|uniref:photosystem II core complex proteins psbY, chloroplastic-like n=1 Tax=Salvia splendens TaxID=180675 RepID=UPI001C26CA8E|nr:photosystem II core complex proteins psbY, chloroplastic-like [Salvia splendens]